MVPPGRPENGLEYGKFVNTWLELGPELHGPLLRWKPLSKFEK
jgi:hypothetical protein